MSIIMELNIVFIACFFLLEHVPDMTAFHILQNLVSLHISMYMYIIYCYIIIMRSLDMHCAFNSLL